MGNRLVLGVFVSGGGTNLQAIIDACNSGAIDAVVGVVISNKADAYGLQRARDHGISAHYVKVGRYETPGFDSADAEQARLLSEHGVGLVCLAGYMRKTGPRVLAAYPGAVMNIHPALLPSFPGAHGQQDASEYGAKIAGCTVHFADQEFDSGPIIIQAAVPVLDSDDGHSLAVRILEQEHRIYTQAIQWFAEGRLRIEGRTVRVLGAASPPPGASLISPPLEVRK
jgi:phosphoribosylglycinamide formyltransferase 1